ncbi:MAG: hypothetical protein CR971_00295 [candidate division SR1 bacterium]|nr:MAG: hypothetical protein CR971_00295 [candidate division SR1 bacterium]
MVYYLERLKKIFSLFFLYHLFLSKRKEKSRRKSQVSCTISRKDYYFPLQNSKKGVYSRHYLKIDKNKILYVIRIIIWN